MACTSFSQVRASAAANLPTFHVACLCVPVNEGKIDMGKVISRGKSSTRRCSVVQFLLEFLILDTKRQFGNEEEIAGCCLVRYSSVQLFCAFSVLHSAQKLVSPESYTLSLGRSRPPLDAGCGVHVFTAPAYHASIHDGEYHPSGSNLLPPQDPPRRKFLDWSKKERGSV